MKQFDSLFSEREQDAVHQFVTACTIPLIEEDNTRTAVLGTGTLLRVAGRGFLVSTSHTFKDFDPERVGIPVEVVGGRQVLRTLNGCQRHYWPDDGLDVTVVEFPVGEFLDSLHAVHQFLTPDNLAKHGARFDQYFILGYPAAAAVSSGRAIMPNVVEIVTTPYGGAAKAPDFQPDREFLLQYGEYGWTDSGERRDTIALNGMSGAAVWGIRAGSEVPGLWSPGQAVQIVGVQHACLKSEYIRCHYWWLVARMFERIDPGLGAVVMTAISG